MLAIASLLLVVVVSLLITRAAAAILVATGMSSQAASFQARSDFTGAGFTTSESEEVVTHPLRRRVIELAAGLLALPCLSRSSWVDRRLTALIGRMLHRYTDVAVREWATCWTCPANHAVIELAVEAGDWTAGRCLGELALREEGVVILGITGDEGRYVASPTRATRIDAGDVLQLHGDGDAVRELDMRPSGREGDLAHERAVRRRLQDSDAA